MKTFAQILTEHTKLYSDKARTARELLNSSKNVTDPEAKLILSRLTGQRIEEIKNAFRAFAAEYGKELKTLQTYLKNNKSTPK